MRALLLGALPLTLLAACGEPDLRATPPAPPDANDPAFSLSGWREWSLVGDGLTPGDATASLRVTAPAGTEVVDAWIGDLPGIRLTRAGATFALDADVAALPPGDHDVLLAADGEATAFAQLRLRRTHALYVLVSTDWDFSDPGRDTMAWHSVTLHARHPDVKVTHFLAPYTFTDPAVSDAREAEIVAWARQMRDEYGDELALHIHPYCHFVTSAGLDCITDQSTVYAQDDSGYTIRVSAYGEDDFRTLVAAADELFQERGLGKPVTFRAGGWTATIETLRALAAEGYVADTSANNWARMEEWEGQGTLYTWNMANWGPIGDTSQPYYPSEDDILSSAEPTLPILEVPDNAIMVDYVSVEEMVEIFEANWGGGPLAAPTSYMMGFHPALSFGDDERLRVLGLLEHTDQFQAADGRGPVVYALLRDMPRVWTRP
jgi:hypothetical protein